MNEIKKREQWNHVHMWLVRNETCSNLENVKFKKYKKGKNRSQNVKNLMITMESFSSACCVVENTLYYGGTVDDKFDRYKTALDEFEQR